MGVNQVAEQIKTKRKSLRVSREKLARVAGMSASTVGRAEKAHPSVTPAIYESLQVALAVLDGERRRAGSAPAAGGDVVKQIEEHAQAVLELVKRWRQSP